MTSTNGHVRGVERTSRNWDWSCPCPFNSPPASGQCEAVWTTAPEFPPAPRRNGSPPDRVDLTPREQEVLRGLVEGLSYKQVASTLGIRLNTVRSYIKTIYRKLQVHGVAEAVTRALRERLV